MTILTNHPFWGLLLLAVLAWYSTVTVYVAVRGFLDIKHMLRRLEEDHARGMSGRAGAPGGPSEH